MKGNSEKRKGEKKMEEKRIERGEKKTCQLKEKEK